MSEIVAISKCKMNFELEYSPIKWSLCSLNWIVKLNAIDEHWKYLWILEHFLDDQCMHSNDQRNFSKPRLVAIFHIHIMWKHFMRNTLGEQNIFHLFLNVKWILLPNWLLTWKWLSHCFFSQFLNRQILIFHMNENYISVARCFLCSSFYSSVCLLFVCLFGFNFCWTFRFWVHWFW